MSSRGVIRFLKKIEELDTRYSPSATEEDRKKSRDAYKDFDRESRNLTRFYNSAFKPNEESKNDNDGDDEICDTDEEEDDEEEEDDDDSFIEHDEDEEEEEENDHDDEDDETN